jgi:hypothetical protein
LLISRGLSLTVRSQAILAWLCRVGTIRFVHRHVDPAALGTDIIGRRWSKG